MSRCRRTIATPAVRRRAVSATVAATLLLAATVGYATVALRSGRGLPCLFRALTGWLCPGCGMTHALASLLRLNIREAFAWNALFPVYIVYLGWLFVSMIRRYVRTGLLVPPSRPLPIHIGTLGLLLCYGILRNLL